MNTVSQGVTGYNFKMKNVFLSLKIIFVVANSVDSDEMPHYAAFHLGKVYILKESVSIRRFKVIQPD